MKQRIDRGGLAAIALACAAAPALAQDAVRGAAFYRTLPGTASVGSCLSCHGEPINNRNSVLRGATGGPLISRTINAVGAMGYLRQYLSEADLADIAAYLATVVSPVALETLPEPWPTVDDFGVQAVGTQAAERALWIRNLQPRSEVAVGTVVSSDAMAFPVQHECPLSLPPLAQCRVRTWFRPQNLGPAEARIDIQAPDGRVLRSARLLGSGGVVQPPALAWVPATALLDFDRVEVGRSAEMRLQLHNTGSTPVALQRLRTTGPQALRFAVTADCATAGGLAAGARCEVTITHTPRAAERAESWVELSSDAGNAPLLRMQAIGVAAAPPPASAAQPAAEGAGGAASPGWLLALCGAVLALRFARRRR